MKRIISVLLLVCMLISQNSIFAYANISEDVEVLGVTTTQLATPKKTYEPNTQTYTTEDGSSHTIYWAQGITPPKMTSDKSLQGTTGYFEREAFSTSTGTHEVFQYPYEPGNGYYDLNKNTYRMGLEHHLCYLGSAMNLLYWWMGQNKNYIAEYRNRLENTDIFSQPNGLRKILPYDKALWDDILAEPPINWVDNIGYSQEITTSQLAKRAMGYYLGRDKGFYTDAVIDFFINGYEAANASDGTYPNNPDEYKKDSVGGFFYPIFDKQMITKRYQDSNAARYKFYNDNVARLLNEGYGIGIAYLIGGQTLAHAITVWGAEYDENGNLVRFFVTDTDDYEYPTNMKSDTLRGIHSMNVFPDPNGLMVMNNNLDNKTDGAKVYFMATIDLAQDKWEQVLNDPAKPKDANITSQPKDELYPVGANPRPTKVIAEAVDRSFLTYQWYECDVNGNSPVKLQGQTTDTLKPDISSIGTKYYYCDVISNKNGHEHPTKTRVLKITVDPNVELTNAQAPGFNFNYYTQVCDINDNVVLNTYAYSKDGGELSFEWFECADSSGRDARKINGQNGDSLKVATDKSTKRYYYCEITNTNNNATGTRVVTSKTGVKCIVVDASDRTAANAIVNMIKAIDPNDYSPESYKLLQDYYKVYERDLGRGNTQAEVDAATSELIMVYEALVPYLKLDLAYDELMGSVNVSYDNISNSNKSNSILFGKDVTLKANVNNGYEFIGWYESVTQRVLSNSATYTLKITSKLNIEPLFKKTGTANLIFTNRTGQYAQVITKANNEWSQITTIKSLLPKVPYSYGYVNGRWVYNDNDILSQLRIGKDVIITPQYDKSQDDLPQLPAMKPNAPNIELHYRYDQSARVGSFILASAIPQNCKVVSSGVIFDLGTKDTFDPTSVILNLNNKTLVSQFTDSLNEPLNIVNILRLDSRNNVAAKGYVTYYDNTGSLKTAYTNQINVVNCKSV